MKRTLGAILFVIYAIVAITVTVLLLSYNDYNCSEIGGYTVFVAQDDGLEPQYKRGSILIAQHSSDRNIQVGDELLIYKVLNSQEYEVVTRTLESKKQQGRHIMYDVDQDESYATDYVIGKTENVTVIEGWGFLLSFLESKWGYLFCIVIVSLLLFLQEVFDLVIELKYGGGKSGKSGKTTKSTTRSAGTRTSSGATRTASGTRASGTRTTRTSTASGTRTTASKPKTVKPPVEEVQSDEVKTEVEEG